MAVTKEQICNSALWAAYGDALGFMTELATSKSLVKRRTGLNVIEQTVDWERKIGGKYGIIVSLPAGCYSDDTQLRLATGRAINKDGGFDPEVFAKVELPVWLSYSLGAGTGSKAAANALTRASSNWHSNFFNKTRDYFQCGGNGAAMRIQPHVWSNTSPQRMLKDVIRNSIITHGHPRGILGAVFHALCVEYVLREGKLPPPEEWHGLAVDLKQVPEIINSDDQLNTFWLPIWEDNQKQSFRDACDKVVTECVSDIQKVEKFRSSGPNQYEELVHGLGGFEAETRGSGTKSAIIALVHAWLFREIGCEQALIASANLLNSDTDTIGTMSGAILGAIEAAPPCGQVLDKNYILFQALRFLKIREKSETNYFQYPDLMSWTAPKTQADYVGNFDGAPYVIGLGRAEMIDKPFFSQNKIAGIWQWLKTEFGQSLLCKRRNHPSEVSSNYVTMPNKNTIDHKLSPSDKTQEKNADLFSSVQTSNKNPSSPNGQLNIDRMTSDAIQSGFNHSLIGKHLLEISSTNNGIEQAIAYTAIISKAYTARRR